MVNKQKLELTWIGKDTPIKVEARILVHDPTKDYGDKTTDNMLIYGDNLLALKALEQDYAGKIKCIYIDPPYNTGSAFEHYDDNLEHSNWLSLMKPRLEILRNLLADDGSLWISIDYNELAYLKIMCDEIFGRQNEISLVTVKVKDPAGVGQQSVIFDVSEYILAYAKNLKSFKEQDKELFELSKITEPVKGYNNFIKNYGEPQFIKTIERGGVGKVNIYSCKNALIENANTLSFQEYLQNFANIAADYNAGGGMIVAIRDQIPSKGLSFIEYTPLKGKNKGKNTKVYFKNRRILSFLSSISENIDNKPYKKSKLTNIWSMKNSALHLEGGVDFPNGKKAEHLIQKILDISTNPGDLVLDSFLGSGTTAAVAHKMGRKYIGIELGEHCHTHCIPRLQKVIDGTDQGGISKAVNWQGGGGFKYYYLAPSLLNKDKYGQYVISKEYNADMLAAAVAKNEGFKYAPSQEQFWKQGQSSEADFIYTTTNHVGAELLSAIAQDMKPGESLLICCKSFDSGLSSRFANITVKKIPAALLGRCEFGKDNYNLNIINPPVLEEEED